MAEENKRQARDINIPIRLSRIAPLLGLMMIACFAGAFCLSVYVLFIMISLLTLILIFIVLSALHIIEIKIQCPLCRSYSHLTTVIPDEERYGYVLYNTVYNTKPNLAVDCPRCGIVELYGIFACSKHSDWPVELTFGDEEEIE